MAPPLIFWYPSLKFNYYLILYYFLKITWFIYWYIIANPFISITFSNLYINLSIYSLKSKGSTLSQNTFNSHFNSRIKIDTNNSFFNSFFIHYHTFSIGLRFSEKGGHWISQTKYSNLTILAYLKCTFTPSFIKI